ncbi:MAG: formylglycine-generating enzyme family protein, partial [Candidatus Tenebribacter davisii]|nr:formylglycine-generating enzyme family protein [Candidatus Tenebribacter davisii]
FEINQANYLSKKENIKIKNKESKKVLLVSIMGSITVETDEPGQIILMNDEVTKFATPHILENIIPNEEYKIAVMNKAIFSIDSIVKIKENEKKVIRITDFIQCPDNMVFVKGGTFDMGSYDGFSEKPKHPIQLASFFIGKYPVTQKEYEGIVGNNPSHFQKIKVVKSGMLGIGRKTEKLTISKNPVESVSWYDAVEFCNRKSSKDGLTPCYSGTGIETICDFNANGYRLPTEAEWEYAARGGNKSKGYKYSGSNNIGDVAWYTSNSSSKTHPVGTKQANELGIYDMTGNVSEWCNDWFDEGYYENSPTENPHGPSSGSNRVDRGGSWYDYARRYRVADRYDGNPDRSHGNLGFRLLRSPK